MDDAFANLMRPIGSERLNCDCLNNFFYSDGQPAQDIGSMLLVSHAAQILGTPVPWEYAHLERYFSRSAATTVYLYMARVRKNWVNPFAESEAMDGIRVQLGQHTFAIPDYTVNPIIVIPDSSQNDELWEDNKIPVWALQQTRLYMALARLHDTAKEHILPGIHVVRLSGNLDADMHIRWIASDPTREDAVLKAVWNVLDKRAASGQPVLPAPAVLPKKVWSEIKETRKEESENVVSNALHELIGQYMLLRSQRKALEHKSKALKEEENAIGASLIGMIQDAEMGYVIDTDLNLKYTVYHKASPKRTPKITPALIRLFAPECSFAIQKDENAKGRVDISVL